MNEPRALTDVDVLRSHSKRGEFVPINPDAAAADDDDELAETDLSNCNNGYCAN